jgi:hypothetical protein
MADKRISQLVDRGTVVNSDVVPIVVSGAVTTNKATISSIQTFMQGNLDLGVTSVGITFGTSGTDINASGSPVTSSGNITINLPTASATNRGALSSADWITFNAKQPAGNYVTLDTTQTITAQKTFTTSGSSDTMIISHGSGSGFALDVIKAGSGEAIRVTKTSGSGNAMSITGGNFGAEAATFSGIVTTTPDAVINSINIGKGAGNVVSNTRVGLSALQANTTGNQNTAVGNQVLNANTSAAFNTGIGYNALLKTTTGSGNTAVGAQALVENTTGPQNTAVGVFALQVNTTAAANTAIGYASLYTNTTGLYNTGLGSETLNQNTTGSNNTAAGRVALRDNTTGSQNAAFGNLALYFNTTGSQNTGIGYSALGGITTGINNVAVGNIAGNLINSGTANITSSNSVYLGHDTRASASGNTNEIVIGYEGRGNGSNTVTIGNSSITNNYFTGNVNGGSFVKTSGTSSQFLKADGSVDSSTYLTTGSAASTYLPLAGGTLTGALNGTSASFTGDVSISESANILRFGNLLRWGFQRPTTDNRYVSFVRNANATAVPVWTVDGDNGNVGIGTASPNELLSLFRSAGTASYVGMTSGTSQMLVGVDSAGLPRLFTGGLTDISFWTNSTERMRITSGGYLQLSNDGNYIASGSPYHQIKNTAATMTVYLLNHNAAGDGLLVNLNTNGTDYHFFRGYSNSVSANRIIIYSNGNIQNANNSYGALSDAKLKENIQDASPKLDDLMKVKIRNYNLIGEDNKQIGVIAQELEEVFPRMIDESEDYDEVDVPQLDEEGNEVLNEEGEVVTIRERVNKGTKTKSVKYSVFVPMLIKAIQELKTEIDSLKNQIK